MGRATTSMLTVSPDPREVRRRRFQRPEAGVDAAASELVAGGASVDKLVQWVDNDPSRATAVLAAEASRPKPRKTLTAQLLGVSSPEGGSSDE